MGRTRGAWLSVSRPTAVAVAVLALAALASALSPAQGAEGAVALLDDGGGRALFDASTPLAPGHPRSACITVSATGAYATDTIALAAVNVAGALAPDLQVQVSSGTGGGGGDCTGFTGTTTWSGTLAGLAAVTGDGVPVDWHPARTARRSFRFDVSIPDDASVQGRSATGVFVWRLVTGARPPVVRPTPTPGDPTPTPTTDPTTPTSPTTPPTPTTDPTTPTTDPTTAGPVVPTGPPDVEVTPRPGPVARAAAAVGTAVAKALGPWLDARTAAQIGDTVAKTMSRPAVPLAVLLLALVFLLVQHTLDQRDPKLARAAVNRRDTELEFPDLFPPREVTP